jgi:hypothetical protein
MTKTEIKIKCNHRECCYECEKYQKEENRFIIAYLLLSNILVAISFGSHGWKAFTDIWYLWVSIPIIFLVDFMGWMPPWKKKKTPAVKKTTPSTKNYDKN